MRRKKPPRILARDNRETSLYSLAMSTLPAHLSKRPTAIQVEMILTVNGGDIRDEELARIKHAMINALHAAAEKERIVYGVRYKLRSISEKAFAAMLARRKP